MTDETPPNSIDAFAGINTPTEDINEEVPEARRKRPYYTSRAAAEIHAILLHWNKHGRKELHWDSRKLSMSQLSIKQKLTNGLLYLRDHGTPDQKELAHLARISVRRQFIVLTEVPPEGEDLLMAARFADKTGGAVIFELFKAWLADPARADMDKFQYPDATYPEIEIDEEWQGKFREEFIAHRNTLFGSVREDSVKVVYKKQVEE